MIYSYSYFSLIFGNTAGKLSETRDGVSTTGDIISSNVDHLRLDFFLEYFLLFNGKSIGLRGAILHQNSRFVTIVKIKKT